jgi:hypothetical protein
MSRIVIPAATILTQSKDKAQSLALKFRQMLILAAVVLKSQGLVPQEAPLRNLP